ncbi:MAG TPA: sn-glycerol-3-phosphate ABC transporter ATP-binding protein UgpC [Spirochaetales bacterium]|nr:sn-glycerol-3-phosphate ABC transporter ATP-binding protein UgpC [Spirochaetales bacterium]HRY53938.1 sn-glycerol-3-phosphate ABC transporter ATP-binding protein UgpC [Spirochaetia bacterium]HRZ64113.1 sn-glycerol-3-phosphate ABC transporter ATP-binding protein UgpC [Spirochaetia bacterium]
MAKVELKKIGKVYEGNVRAVDDANITINDREFVVLVGPSGCGKSTTLRMVAGLEDITEGELSIDGKIVNDVPPKDRDIAMVFQNYALYPHMTVYENMAFGLRIRKLPKDEIDKRVRDAAKTLDIEKLLDRRPKQLSGGQRQRVAIGRAIVRNPKVFLFDEPLSNLDAKLRVQMRIELIELHDRLNATMIYVTHDQVEAMTMGTKIVVMRDGKVQQIGSPLYLYNQPINKFVAGFLGTPPMNFMTVKVVEEGGAVKVDEGSFVLTPAPAHQALLKPYVGKEVSFGIRPEDLPHSESRGQGTIPAKVNVVEPLGADINVYAATAKHSLTARLPPHHVFKAGEEIAFAPVMTKACYFDKESEVSILPVKWDEQA